MIPKAKIGCVFHITLLTERRVRQGLRRCYVPIYAHMIPQIQAEFNAQL
jgi:hypothetical protein